MRSRSVRVLLAASLLAISACARAGMRPALEQDELTPPRPISGDGPAFVGATPQTPVAIEILVRVDTLGRADLTTLQLSGTGVERNRQAIVDWLRVARFEPARLNGYVVSGWFRVAAEARSSRSPD